MTRALRTWLVFVLALLALLVFARPALADDAMADGVEESVDTGTIDASQPHVGGYTANSSRLNAKPSGLGAGAYDQVPASVDLRQYAPAVGDQGSIGMCVAWTLARNIMGWYVNRSGGTDAPYAPLYLYMRNVAAGGAPSSGLNPDAVLANLQAYGVDSQDDYFQGTSNYKVAPTQAQVANAANYKITSWKRLFSGANQGTNAKTVIQQSLANNMPVAVGFPVYSDFMNLGAHTLYNTLTGNSLGGHMVTAFAYDSDGLYLRNQWGTGWGNSGEAHVSWAFVQTVMTGAYVVGGITTPSTSVPVQPQVTALSVSKGTAGGSVTITGAGMAKATAVTFGGTAATFTRSVTNGVTRLVATVPSRAAGTVDVQVSGPAGVSDNTAADDFTYPAPKPAVTGLSPNSGPTTRNTTVTVTGTDFTDVTKVVAGSVALDFDVLSPTSLRAVLPARSSAGSFSVQVTNSGGTSTGTSAGVFTYVLPSAPVISGLSPNSGQATGTTQVTVTGTNFDDASAVTVAGESVPFAAVSGTQIRVNLAPHAAGAVDVRVTTPGGTSAPVKFTYVAVGVPTVTSLSPNSGATNVTTTVVATGTNLTGVTKVLLGGTALSYTMVDATTLKVFVKPRAAGAASLTVTTNGGTSAPVTFTAVAPTKPVITALSPASGLTNATTAVTVTGSGFTGATRVSLGGSAMSFTRVSDTRLTFNAPPHRAAALPVVVVGPGGTSASKTFTYKSTLVPVLTSMSPSSGYTTGSTATVLTGRYLTGASLVTADTARVSFTRVSDTQIKITLVRHAAGTVQIKVKTAGGTSNALTFRYVPPPTPVVTSLNPTTGTAGTAATITVTGRYLQGVTRVTLGGTGVAFTQVSATQITVKLPARPAGGYDLVVTTGGGTSAPARWTVS